MRPTLYKTFVLLLFAGVATSCLSDPSAVEFGEEGYSSTTGPARTSVGLVAYYPLREFDRATRTSPDESGRPWASALEYTDNVVEVGTRGLKMGAGDGLSLALGEGLARIRSAASFSFELWLHPVSTPGVTTQALCELGHQNNPRLTVTREADTLVVTAADAEPEDALRLEQALPDRDIQLVVTYSQQTARIYLDGMLVHSWVTSWPVSEWRNSALRCGSGQAETQDGETIEVAFGDLFLIALYDRALRPVEVWNHYEIGDRGAPEREGYAIASDLVIDFIGPEAPSRAGGSRAHIATISGREGEEFHNQNNLELSPGRRALIQWEAMAEPPAYARAYFLVSTRGNNGENPIELSAAWALREWSAREVNWLGPQVDVPWAEPGAEGEGEDRTPFFATWPIRFNGAYHLPLPSTREELTGGHETLHGLILETDQAAIRIDHPLWYRAPQLLFVNRDASPRQAPTKPDITDIQSASGSPYLVWSGDEGAVFELYRNGSLVVTTTETEYQDSQAPRHQSHVYVVIACTRHGYCSAPSQPYPFSN